MSNDTWTEVYSYKKNGTKVDVFSVIQNGDRWSGFEQWYGELRGIVEESNEVVRTITIHAGEEDGGYGDIVLTEGNVNKEQTIIERK